MLVIKMNNFDEFKIVQEVFKDYFVFNIDEDRIFPFDFSFYGPEDFTKSKVCRQNLAEFTRIELMEKLVYNGVTVTENI